jgi:5-methylthioribose kinase
MLKFSFYTPLLFPIVEFVSRLWMTYIFVKETLPKISSSTSMLQGLVEFLLPHMEKCHTFFCEIAFPGENNKELIDVILRKFLKPI